MVLRDVRKPTSRQLSNSAQVWTLDRSFRVRGFLGVRRRRFLLDPLLAKALSLSLAVEGVALPVAIVRVHSLFGFRGLLRGGLFSWRRVLRLFRIGWRRRLLPLRSHLGELLGCQLLLLVSRITVDPELQPMVPRRRSRNLGGHRDLGWSSKVCRFVRALGFRLSLSRTAESKQSDYQTQQDDSHPPSVPARPGARQVRGQAPLPRPHRGRPGVRPPRDRHLALAF